MLLNKLNNFLFPVVHSEHDLLVKCAHWIHIVSHVAKKYQCAALFKAYCLVRKVFWV